MFHSTTLMAAIYADRQREIERIGRDRRLLYQPSDAVGVRPEPSPTTVVTATNAGSLTTRARSSGSACEAV